MNTNYKAYAALTAQIKALEADRDVLKPIIIADLTAVEMKTVKNEFGEFTLVDRKAWTYSELVAKKEAALKIQKMTEEMKGIATCTVSTSLRYQ